MLNKLFYLFTLCVIAATASFPDDLGLDCGGNFRNPVLEKNGNLVDAALDSIPIIPAVGEFRVLVLWCRFESQGPDEQVMYDIKSNAFQYPDPVTMEMADTLIFDNRYPGPWHTPQYGFDPVLRWENYVGVSQNDYFRAVSNDRVRISGEVAGPYILDDLDTTNWFYEFFGPAIDSAVADGYNIEYVNDPVPMITGGDWDIILIINPKYNECRNCNTGGVRFQRIVWINDNMRYFLLVHEIAHTFEIKHSNGWFCHKSSWPSPDDTSCGTIAQQGDRYDPMSGGAGHLNSRVKEAMGWIDSDQVEDITHNGTYVLSPIQTALGLKVLRIPRDTAYYYYHFRAPLDFDKFPILDTDAFTRLDGLFGMRVDPFNTNFDNLMLDMPPLSLGSNQNINRVTLLEVGNTYTDSTLGVSLQVVSVTGVDTSARLTVDVDIELFGDYDGDGITNGDDNCVSADNPGQQDADGDGTGDACCCVGIRGDVNQDGADANILDLTFLVDFIFRGGEASGCPNEANLNGDLSSGNIVDLTFCVDRVFRGGPAPTPCP